ncbi:ABC-type sugar transport system ATPase subunit [Bradyrhizobium sp. LM6.9]
MPEGHQPILELQGITKSFGGVEALRGVDFALSPGEIHGLVGENGAGKSTLMKIIAGVHTEFSGRFLIDGQETHFRSARDAHSAGIAMVHQELSVDPPTSRSPRTCFWATSRPTGSAWYNGGAWRARPANSSPASASTSIR